MPFRASRKCDFYERPSLRRNYVGLVRWSLSANRCALDPLFLSLFFSLPLRRSGLVIRALQARRGVSAGGSLERPRRAKNCDFLGICWRDEGMRANLKRPLYFPGEKPGAAYVSPFTSASLFLFVPFFLLLEHDPALNG